MIAVAVALSLLAPSACPSADATAEILALHETARQAHLRGDPAPMVSTLGDQLLMADNGGRGAT
jgi:hypothetical protein